MSSDRTHHLEVVEQFFSGPRDLDRLSLLSDDCEWFNGIGKFPAAPGQTVFRGKDEIGRVILGRAPSPLPLSGRKVDRYDLTTARFHDVETIADGPYVFRQHGYTATTVGGRDYANVYGFLFRFDDRRPDRPRLGALGHPRRVRAALPVRPRGRRPRRPADDDAVGAAAPRPRATGPPRGHRAVPRRRRARAERLEHPALQVPLHRRRRTQARDRRALPRRDAGVHGPAAHRRARGQRRPHHRAPAAHRPQRVPPARPPARGTGAVRAHRRRAHRRPRHGRAGRTHLGVLAVEPAGDR